MARRATSTTFMSIMPAAIEMGAREPASSDAPRYHWARPQGSPIGGYSPPARGAIRASLRAGHREWPRSNPLGSCLTLRQPFGAKWAMLHGPDRSTGGRFTRFSPSSRHVGGPVSVPCPAAPVEAANRRPPRSSRPLQASGPRKVPQPKPRMLCANRSNRLPRADGPGTTRERGRLCESCPQISWHVSQRRGMRDRLVGAALETGGALEGPAWRSTRVP
jgi:hypothetical protein